MNHSAPGRKKPPARLRPLDFLGFLAFSHGWTWGFWALAGSLGDSVHEFPAALFFYIGGAGVLLGALVMAGIVYGREGLWDLGRRLVDPRPVAGRWGLVAFFLFPLLTCAAAIIAVAGSLSPSPLDPGGAVTRLHDPTAFLIFVVFILIMGPLPEEIGWRGYLLDRLQLRWDALVSSLLIAAVWWIWHGPLFVLPGYFDAFHREPPTPWDLLHGIVPAAILYTWVYNNTDRSILALIVLHFMHNFTGALLGITEEVRPVRLILEAETAAAVVLFWGPRTFRRGRPVPLPPQERGPGS